MDGSYQTSRENSLELLELSSINKVRYYSLVSASRCDKTGTKRGEFWQRWYKELTVKI